MMPGDGVTEITCPYCKTVVVESKFCANCGKNLENLKKVVEERRNPFSPDDAALLDKLLFNLKDCDPEMSTKDHKTIRALGDIVGVPMDYKGSVYSTGSIIFSEGTTSKLHMRYPLADGFERAYPFKEALIIKRTGDDRILIQTDLDTYFITASEIGPSKMRYISRTPIAIVKKSGSYYMMCEKDGRYISCHNISLDLGKINRISVSEFYDINTNWNFEIKAN